MRALYDVETDFSHDIKMEVIDVIAKGLQRFLELRSQWLELLPVVMWLYIDFPCLVKKG